MAQPEDKKKKVKGFKEFDGSKFINIEPELDDQDRGRGIKEAAGSTVVITFARMNPITAGHELLVQRMITVAKKQKATPMVFLTHSNDKKKNPLQYNDKVKFAQKAFGPIVQKSPANTIVKVLQAVEKFDNLIMVVGSDRVNQFKQLLNDYNGKDYSFDSIAVVSAGARDPDSDNVDGMSASKMRALAVENDILQFTKGLPKKLRSSAKAIMTAVRKGMNMTEETNNISEVLNRMQRRKRGLAMRKARFKIKRGKEKAAKRTASQEVLKGRARKAAINIFKKKFSKSRRYADLSAGEKEVIDKRISKLNKKRIEQIARKLLPVVKQKERERRKSMMSGGSSPSSSSVVKKEDINEASLKDRRVLKKPHMLLDKNNKPKLDARFKMFKKKHVTEDVGQEIFDLIESTEQFNEISKKTLGSYIKKADKKAAKAGNSYSNAANRRHDFADDTPAMAKNARIAQKRTDGADLARKKLNATYEATIPDGQTAMTKREPLTKNDTKTLKKLRDMMGKEKKPVRKEEAGAGEEGTDKLVNKFKKDTPNA